jgi:hypothetical protein
MLHPQDYSVANAQREVLLHSKFTSICLAVLCCAALQM